MGLTLRNSLRIVVAVSHPNCTIVRDILELCGGQRFRENVCIVHAGIHTSQGYASHLQDIEVYLCVVLKCLSFVLLPRSTASLNESLSVLPRISGTPTFRQFVFPPSRPKTPRLLLRAPLGVPVVACALNLRSTRYVLRSAHPTRSIFQTHCEEQQSSRRCR